MNNGLTGLWAPRAGWFGTQLIDTEVALGTGGTSIGNSTTTSVLLPVPGFITSYSKGEAKLVALNMQGLVAAVMGSGTILAQAFRRINAGTPADQALTAATLDLSATGMTSLDWTFAWPITATDSQCLFKTTDACRIDIVTTGTVNTQPTATIGALWAIRRVS